ncbi:shutdown [Carabus blaptoides fortunei]
MQNDYSDVEADAGQTGHVRLREGINLNTVLNGETFEINFDSIQNDEDGAYNPKDIDVAEIHGAALGIDSDDNDDDDLNSTPFDKLASKMVNITPDGKIKKRIKRQGTGETPPGHALVTVRYSSYLEYNDEPSDCAYIKKPYQFRLGNAGVIGLNFAVQSMRVNEKAQFLIHHDYAFGQMGHPPRVPACATFLFYIELIRFIDSGAALEMSKLTLEEKRTFPIAYKTALALIENGKEHFRLSNLKLAIREYNKAAALLCECNLSDMSEQEKQQKLLFKIYTNLAICYNKDGNPKKACSMCNNIYAMSKNTSLSIPTKVYFHNGRALLMLNEFQRAREKLLMAQKLEPHNPDISAELAIAVSKLQEEGNRERAFARALLKNKQPLPQAERASDAVVNENFRTVMRTQCKELIRGDKMQFKLPGGLTEDERQVAKYEAEKVGLKLSQSQHENDGQLVYFITKP